MLMQDEATTIASGIDEVLQETNMSSKKEDSSGWKDESQDDKKKCSIFFDTGESFTGRSPAIMFLDPVLSLADLSDGEEAQSMTPQSSPQQHEEDGASISKEEE